MPTYYVQIPSSEAPTAEVSASSTKHARTVYLDYLSRNNIISWQQRQSTRKLVKVSKMEPGEIRTQVQLDYDMEPGPPVQEAVIEESPYGTPYEQERDIIAGDDLSDEEYEEHQNSGAVPPRLKEGYPDLFQDSPIAKLSKKSKGM